MKQVMVIMLVLGLAVTAGAQGKINPKVLHTPRTKVIVVRPSYYGPMAGFGYRNSLFYNRYNSFYSPFYDPFYGRQRVETVPSELQLEIDKIENNFSYEISKTRKDKSVPGKERRQKIRDLKHQRENAIIDVKRNYYKSEKKQS